MRPTCGGTDMGRRESAAADTPTIAPESQPAGMPASPSVAAPRAPKAIVSAKRRASSLRLEEAADINSAPRARGERANVDADQCPRPARRSNAWEHRRHAFAEREPRKRNQARPS